MLVVVENTPDVHNLVVCTLCSCYPVAGARAAAHLVQDAGLPLARGQRAADVLRELALEVPAEREMRVWDSSAEMRYMVLPMRPAGTEGMSEERAGRR